RGEDVGPEPGDALVDARARVGHQLEHGTLELHDLLAVTTDHEPGGSRWRPVVVEDAPRTGHAQVRVDREVVGEADEEVLAEGVDAADHLALQALGPAV